MWWVEHTTSARMTALVCISCKLAPATWCCTWCGIYLHCSLKCATCHPDHPCLIARQLLQSRQPAVELWGSSPHLYVLTQLYCSQQLNKETFLQLLNHGVCATIPAFQQAWHMCSTLLPVWPHETAAHRAWVERIGKMLAKDLQLPHVLPRWSHQPGVFCPLLMGFLTHSASQIAFSIDVTDLWRFVFHDNVFNFQFICKLFHAASLASLYKLSYGLINLQIDPFMGVLTYVNKGRILPPLDCNSWAHACQKAKKITTLPSNLKFTYTSKQDWTTARISYVFLNQRKAKLLDILYTINPCFKEKQKPSLLNWQWT